MSTPNGYYKRSKYPLPKRKLITHKIQKNQLKSVSKLIYNMHYRKEEGPSTNSKMTHRLALLPETTNPISDSYFFLQFSQFPRFRGE